MILIGLAISFFSTAPKVTAKVDPSLVMHFSFDAVKGKEVIDESGKGNNGEIVGKPEFIDGKYGKAIQRNNQIKSPFM